MRSMIDFPSPDYQTDFLIQLAIGRLWLSNNPTILVPQSILFLVQVYKDGNIRNVEDISD